MWAAGDQSLTRETAIPGDDEALDRYRVRWGDPTDHTEDWLVGEEWADRPASAPNPDVVTALAAYAREGRPPARHQRLRLLLALFPHADHVAVCDRDVDYLEDWRSYYPWEFKEALEDGLVDAALAPEAPR
ncbi:hypothetical protein [Saliphagus infecundisoli]|uniref:Uncharacterized protein n=1 Tax=Saliphagus infecundisoli TaxID=1849069 RepID=A0ABD5QAG9_9EURY|nr:hypothetical protein [Saliphagus infecundisoli]